MDLKISPKEIFIKNLYLLLLLFCANALGILSKFYFDHGRLYGLVSLFCFDEEKNIPTLYSSISLMLSGGLLLSIAYAHRKLGSSYLHWLGLSLIFLFLSVDEMSSIHERLIGPVRNMFETSGLLYFAWVIPYGILLIVLVIVYLKFLFRLPKRTMTLFMLSGVVFVSGAIGFELLGGRHAELFGYNNLFRYIMSNFL